VFATSAEISAKRRALAIGLDDEAAECICLHENFSLKLLPYHAFVMHAALISYQGRGYAIVAPRGGGKTTHARLWQSVFGSDVHIINGDKPVIRQQKDGTFLGYGTPWCGKEGVGENASVPLCGICFLKQAEVDEVRPVCSDEEYVKALIRQVVFPPERACMDEGARLLAALIRSVPAVVASCTMGESAARMVYHALMR
jgi:hypothetical protein